MDTFDIEAYKQKCDIEDTYIVNRFIQRRKKIEEGSGSHSRKYLNRDHAAANQRLIDDYFANEPTYDDAMFRRRYRMQKYVFLRIVGDLSSSDNYFTQRVDAANKEGTLNDINVLDRSPVFDDVEQGNAPRVNFFVNQRPYSMAYYLAEGIYPSYPTFVKSIRLPQSEPGKLFAKHQEACRKDIERAFGVLRARFKIISEPACLWDIADLGIIMRFDVSYLQDNCSSDCVVEHVEVGHLKFHFKYMGPT
ncbi:uncharacterized protein [Medicago truncatula]|uniref:uncharacterized protein n=1 Tax=Medicago truncatula TaxID=3880 RepID=UPI000D2F2BF4|nr:uncharacterized protein LOC112422736 [Medicago truncatula]